MKNKSIDKKIIGFTFSEYPFKEDYDPNLVFPDASSQALTEFRYLPGEVTVYFEVTSEGDCKLVGAKYDDEHIGLCAEDIDIYQGKFEYGY